MIDHFRTNHDAAQAGPLEWRVDWVPISTTRHIPNDTRWFASETLAETFATTLVREGIRQVVVSWHGEGGANDSRGIRPEPPRDLRGSILPASEGVKVSVSDPGSADVSEATRA